MRLALAAAIFLLVLATAPARALTFEVAVAVRHGARLDTTLYAHGDIEAGDDGKLHRVVAGLPRDTHVVAIVLDSIGGQVADALDLADTIHRSALSTTVRGYCESACILLFLAGRERAVVEGAWVGVHSAIEGTEENWRAKASTMTIVRKLVEFGATPAVLGKLVMTPPHGMAFLTRADLVAMGVRILRVDGTTPGAMLP